jgi:hypothetical protein
MLFILPKFPMLNSPNSAYYARITPHYAQFCLRFQALCQYTRFAYYAESNAGTFRLALFPDMHHASAAPRTTASPAAIMICTPLTTSLVSHSNPSLL